MTPLAWVGVILGGLVLALLVLCGLCACMLSSRCDRDAQWWADDGSEDEL